MECYHIAYAVLLYIELLNPASALSVCVSCTLNGFYQSSSSSPHPHRNLDVTAVRGEQVAATFLRITASHAYPPSPKRLT
jgi:hypothetical protein